MEKYQNNMKTIGLIFGGPSNEHEVSIVSAGNIVKNFDYSKYKLALIFWDKQGVFYRLKSISDRKNKTRIVLEDFKKIFDIALLMTHGKYGEDGVLQGLLESQKIKYCGCRVLSSALCMDKAVFKKFLAGQKINQVKFEILDYSLETKEIIEQKIKRIRNTFKLPLYIKPANSGSSVGITKVTGPNKFKLAVAEALKHDNKIVVEEGLTNPREIEVAVLGNQELLIPAPGELALAKDFYSYDDKYKLGEAKPVIPAKLTAAQKTEIIRLAAKTYRLCGCSRFARIDFFISHNKIYLNEINTLPGFTDISMYPMLMVSGGLSYKNLINKIIALAY
jgi:D-alanine-D-alanine ligase